MGIASDYIIDKNKLSGGGDAVKGMYLGGDVMQAYLGSSQVFNRALYSIEAFDILIPAEGTADMKGTCLVDSFKTDRDGAVTEVDYTISPSSLDANDTDDEKTGFYTVTQNVSGLKTTGKYTQAAKVLLGYTYHGLKVTSVTYMYAPANGGFITPVVGYSGTRRAVYSNGDTVDESWGSNTSVLLSATGKALVTGATFDSRIDIGKVYAPDLGTTESDTRAVAQITALTIEAIDGSVLSWNGTVYAYQFENVKTTTYGTPTVTASYTDIGANGSAAVLTITWSQTKTDSYSSGADPVETSLSGTINNSATTGNCITSISGTSYLTGASLVTTSGLASRGNITASSLAYTAKDRTKAYVVSVTVNVNGKSATESVTVYQAANVVSSYYTEPEITSVTATDVGAGGSAASISVKYTQSLVTTSTANPSGKSSAVGGTTSPATVMGETVSNNGAKSGVKIVADSLGTTVKSRTVVYRVVSASVLSNGRTGLWSGELDVYQAANAVTGTTYGAYSASVVATPVSGGSIPTSWQTTVPTTTATNKYLWLQQTVNFSDGTTSVVPSVIGEYRSGRSISSITCYYLASSSSSGVKASSSGWSTSAPNMSSYSKYLWAYQVIEYSDGIRRQTEPIVIATYSSSIVSSISKKYALNSECISNLGGEVRVSVLCQRPATYTYTSGSTSNGIVDANATITTTSGILSASSVAGSGAVTLTLPENTGSGRTITVKATAPDNTQDSATLQQQEVKYEFYSNTLAAIGASGGEMILLIFSTRNDKAFPITASNIAVSGITGTSVVVSVADSTTGEYKVTVSGIGANTSTSQRTFTVTATQPSSGETVTWDATQAGASLIKGKVATILTAQFTNNSTYAGVSYQIYFDATDTTYYTGGTISNVTIQLNTKIDGTGTVIASIKIYDSLQVAAGSKSTTKLGTLNNSTGSSTIYVLVYYDNALQYKTMPMLRPELQ